MPQSAIDNSLQRVAVADFAFPLGVIPAESVKPTQGYIVEFEAADGGESGDWEEWPDRYVYDVAVTATRLASLCRALFTLLPGRIYPILDILGNDAYREVDPYIAYDFVGVDHFLDGVRRHSGWLLEDGLVGFGAMCDDPFIYLSVDEHNLLTIRVETGQQEAVEKALAAFDLHALPDGPITIDTVSHEHRTTLSCPPERPDLMTSEEIIEELIDRWRLRLNIDRERNIDDDGRSLGLTAWRCLVRRFGEMDAHPEYAEALVVAHNYDEAELIALEAALDENPPADDDEAWPRDQVVIADRLRPEQLAQLMQAENAETLLAEPAVHAFRWLPT